MFVKKQYLLGAMCHIHCNPSANTPPNPPTNLLGAIGVHRNAQVVAKAGLAENGGRHERQDPGVSTNTESQGPVGLWPWQVVGSVGQYPRVIEEKEM